MQPDTIIPSLSNPQAWNRYAYVYNNPLRNTDPTGHHCEDEDINGYCPGDVGYYIPGYTPPTHVKLNSEGKISPLSGVVMITCGVEPLDKGTCNNGSSLSLYKEWALSNGYGVVINDVDACGTKYACSSRELSAMQSMLGDNPTLNFILVGHSAGADATILAADRAIGTEIQDRIQNIIILGQYGDYTDPSNPNLNPAPSTNDIANNSLLRAYGSKIIVGDIYEYGGNQINVSPDHYVRGLTDHMGLTTDMTLFLTILDIAGLPR